MSKRTVLPFVLMLGLIVNNYDLNAGFGNVSMVLSDYPPIVIWVTESRDADGDGVQDDQGFIDLLIDAGYDLDVRPDHWVTLDDTKIATLNAADLIVVSRSVNSGNYNQDNEPTVWNGISTPLIQMSSHLIRDNRWQWFTTSDLQTLSPDRTTVWEPSHSLFTGIDLDENNGVRLYDITVGSGQSNFTLAESGGNGSILATTGEGLMQIVEWPADVEFYDGSGQWTGGQRLFFTAGTQESDSTPQGAMNLNMSGQHIFLNMVDYMLGTKSMNGVDINTTADIIWVTDTIDRNADGIQDDQAWTDLLLSQGYDIDLRLDYWLDPLDPDKIQELNEADLIIISRTANSGSYDDTPTEWNSITTPLILMSTHIARNSRWLWFNSTDILQLAPETLLRAPTHPIFAGIDSPVQMFDASVGTGLSNFINVSHAGNGTVLATGDGLVQIAQWTAGTEFYSGSGQVAGGDRLFFVAGTQEIGGEQPQGAMNLTTEGQHLFLNAVDFMLPEFEPLLLENASFELPGTEKQTDWETVPGWNSDNVAVDSGVDTRWSPTDGEWTAYLFGPDPSVWQLTGHTITAGKTITLQVDAQIIWMATTLQMTFYYDDNGIRVPVATTDVALLSETTQAYSLVLNADDIPEAIGQQLGIEFDNVTDPMVGNNWLGLDNVRLDVSMIE